MKGFHIKSLFLGLGIGIIFTAIVGMVFFAGYNPNELSEDEVKQLARQYGMIEPKDAYDFKNVFNKQSQEEKITLTIDEADTIETIAQKLLDMSLIKSKIGIMSYYNNLEEKKEFKPNQYEIAKGTSIEEIIHIITN